MPWLPNPGADSVPRKSASADHVESPKPHSITLERRSSSITSQSARDKRRRTGGPAAEKKWP